MIDWREKKVIVFESDDWGGPDRNGCPDLAAHRRILQCPDIAPVFARANDWTRAMDTLESVDDMDALFKLLSRFRGGDGRPVTFTPVYFLANPDFDAIRANGFSKYVDIGIDKPYPEIWRRRGDIVAKAQEGVRLGVWSPESHNTRAGGHFDPHKWVKLLRDHKDKALNAYFDERMVGKPADAILDVGREFDSMGLDELRDWLREGANNFKNVFGYFPRVSGTADARARCRLLDETVERFLAENGVMAILNATHRRMGERGPNGLVYIRRNADFEPALSPKREDEKWWVACYRNILRAWADNGPAIVNTHRVNYCSLDANRKADAFEQLECLLETIQREHPEAVYRSSGELVSLYREDWPLH